MKEFNKKAVKYTATAILTVTAVGLLVNTAAPNNQSGKWLQFIAPLISATVVGIWIYWKLSEEIKQKTQL